NSGGDVAPSSHTFEACRPTYKVFFEGASKGFHAHEEKRWPRCRLCLAFRQYILCSGGMEEHQIDRISKRTAVCQSTYYSPSQRCCWLTCLAHRRKTSLRLKRAPSSLPGTAFSTWPRAATSSPSKSKS